MIDATVGRPGVARRSSGRTGHRTGGRVRLAGVRRGARAARASGR